MSPTTPIIHLTSVDSTNAEAMRRALAGGQMPLWIRADRQERGRGRSGRPWQSEPGNLYASLLLQLGCPAENAAQLSLVTGVAVVDAINELASQSLAGQTSGALPGLQLKWPNDILIDGAKVGGILIESTRQGDTLTVVIGIGLNLVTCPADVDRRVTRLNLHNIQADPELMLCYVSQHMDRWLGIWQEGAGRVACQQAWLERATPLGTLLSINAGGGPVTGTFQGLDHDGALLLQTSTGRQRFSFGDVTLAGL